MAANETHWFFTPLQEFLTRSQSWKNGNQKNSKGPLLPTPPSTDRPTVERSEMYACGRCPFTGRRETCEKHFLIQHMEEEHVPWMCSLCGFRCKTENCLNSHMTLEIHKRALARKPDEHTVFIQAKNPHQIEVGEDIFLSTEDRPYYFNRGNRFQSRNMYKPVYMSGEYENADDIRYDDDRRHGRRRSHKRKVVRSVEYSKELNGNRWKHSRNDFESESENRPVEYVDSVPIVDTDLGEVHSTTNAGAEEQTDTFDCMELQNNMSADLIGKLIDEMHSTDSNIGLAPRRHYDDVNQLQDTGSNAELSDARKSRSRPRTPQSPSKENVMETSSRISAYNKCSTPNLAIPVESPSGREASQETNEILSNDVHDLDDNADLDIEQGFDMDAEILGDKVTDLIHALDPLKNISKALIAIDYHFRRVFPLLEALTPPVPQSATPTKGQGSMAAGHGFEQSMEFLGQAAEPGSQVGRGSERRSGLAGQCNGANGQSSAGMGPYPIAMDQNTWVTSPGVGQDVSTNKQCSVAVGQGVRSLRQEVWGQGAFVPLGHFSTVTGQSFPQRSRINNDPRTKRN